MIHSVRLIAVLDTNANLAFCDALVQNYDGLIGYLNLPDEKDRHVLAAAIRTNAHVISQIIYNIQLMEALGKKKPSEITRWLSGTATRDLV